MKALDLQSERYAPTGNLASTGARNQLGRPKLDPLTVLVRESVQNGWDARANGAGGVTMSFDLRRATAEQRHVLRETVFAHRPRLGLALGNVVGDGDVLLLTISDRGTIGLGGPTRADVVVPDGEPHDFVDFLRNLGEPPDRSLGGGTYGYGKASLYAASRAGCILVHTRTAVGEARQSRFIGAGLGEPFVAVDAPIRHTGRHWWGVMEDSVAEPLRGAAADELGALLGLPGFEGDGLGTSILVVDLDPGERTDRQAAEHIARSLLWNFWPKLVPLPDGTTPMRFTVSVHGVDVPVHPPLTHHALRMYARALQAARECAAGRVPASDITVKEVRCSQPSRRLGWLALARDLRRTSAGSEQDAAAGGLATDVSSHVAWMRSAELVVQYAPGPPLQADVLHWGGVFVGVADAVVDGAFARAEPPTHDDWVVHQLTDAVQKRYVKAALRRIADEVRDWIEPSAGPPAAGAVASLGSLSNELGRILIGLDGPGGGVESSLAGVVGPSVQNRDEDEDDDSGNGGKRARADADDGDPAPGTRTRPGKPRLRVSTPRLGVEDGLAVLQMDVDVRAGVRTTGTTLTVSACAVLDSGDGEDAPPAGAAVPRVLRWRSPNGTVIDEPGLTLLVEVGNDGRWTLSVALVDDAAVRVTVDAAGAP
jgi:hypothetical protein